MAPNLLLLLLLSLCSLASLAQPPKCAARSTEPSPSCETFAGSWTGNVRGENLYDLYQLSPIAPNGSFSARMVHCLGPGWAAAGGVVDEAARTVSISFDSGVKDVGTLSADCQTIVWASFSFWSRFVPPAKINVHIAPHTHNDVGWRMTYLQYYAGRDPSDYGQNVSKILSTVIPALLANPARRFSYVEQAYFQYWLERQTSAVQEAVRGLVASKQLVFLNGGWSMHDEAAPTYLSMLDNTELGHRYIRENFGEAALPTLSWQIDPFGHSAFNGVLASPLSGFDGLMWAREPQDFKAEACASRGLERVWLPSASLGASAAAFAGVFSSFYYCTPASVERCDNEYGPTPETCNSSWAAVDVPRLVVDIQAYIAPAARGDDVLVLMGDDFTFENGDAYFAYLDALIAALNAASPAINAFYSTPADYVRAKLASVASLPVLTGDLFPYNDDAAGHNMWAGYFSSRPSFKAFVRESTALLNAARQLQALAGGVAGLGPGNALFDLERAAGVAQHHDAIAGTAQQNVNDDYCAMLEAGRAGAFASIAASLAAVANVSAASLAFCPLANATLCPALEAAQPTVALLHNSLGQAAAAAPTRLSVAALPAGRAWAVFDAAGAPVTAQLVPLSARDRSLRALYGGNASVGTAWLCFVAQLPAAGVAAYFLLPSAAADAPLTHESVVRGLPAGAAAGAGAAGSRRAGDGTITNGRLTLTISASTGFVSAFADSASGLALPLSQQWLYYVGADGSNIDGSTQASGAYIMRPVPGDARPLQPGAAAVELVSGPVVSEARSVYAFVSQSARLWAGAAAVEVEWTVGPVDVADGLGREVVTRYASAGLATNGTWRTDSNCRESVRRRRNARRTNATITEPVAANYYPAACLVSASSAGARAATLAVALDRAEGAASLADGALELLVHRRLLHDDGRGVGENLDEPGLDGKGLVVRGRHWLVLAPADAAPAAVRAAQQHALALPHLVRAFAPLGALSPAQWLRGHAGSASLLAAPLPDNVHLATAHARGGGALLLRLAHTFEAGEDATLSQNATVPLARLFAGMAVASAVEMTLPGSQPLAVVPQRTFVTDAGETVTVPVLPAPPSGADMDVSLAPMQIRTFLVQLAASGGSQS